MTWTPKHLHVRVECFVACVMTT